MRKTRWAAGLAVAALLLTAPGCRISSPSVSLAAGKTTITLGDSTTLTAVFPGKPGSATIDNGVGDVTSGVPVTVSPTEDTTYTLTFRPVAKAFTASVTVHVVANPTTPSITVAPRISGGARNLTASVAPQAGCTFLWTITGGSITAGGTTEQVTFSAGTSGSLVLTCAAVNAAGSASQPATATATIIPVAGTPTITAPGFVTAGQPGYQASVPVVAGDSYAWTLTGGTITDGLGTDTITFTPGASGSVQLGCVITNLLGTPGPGGIAFCSIVAPPDLPVITAPASVLAGATGQTASVAAQPGTTYAWTLANGAITDGDGTNSITFTAGLVGSLQLTCVVTNAAGTPSSSVPVTVPVLAAPVILAQPAGVTVSAPTAATFSVVATGNPAPAYQWYLNAAAIPGANAASYTIPATTFAMDGGSYTVAVSNALGSVTSSAAILNVNAGPAITAQPAGITVTAGATATFSVTATGTAPITYQWNLNGVSLGATARAASYTTPVTTLAMNLNSYTVTVTNPLGSVTSSPAILTVDAAPAITAQPVSLTVGAGATATFSVTATGNPAVAYQWNLNGVSLGATARAATYTTPATTLAMNLGSYTVTVSNTLGSVTSSAAILTVNSGPAITAQPAGITVNAGSTATFSVTATGNPAVTYQWNLGGVSLGATARSASYTTAATTLAMNGNSYTVTVTNTLGSVTSSPAILTVDAGPAITVQPVGVAVAAGATATFSVTATGNPAVAYQWNLNGVSLGAGATSASYTTPVTTLAMNLDSYTVTVSNTLGSVTSSAAVLTVNAGPAITVQPVGITVTAGATATFSVTATGNPAVTYQWNLGGVSLGAAARTASYTTAATTLAMNGNSYTVTVTNTLGSVTSAAAILTVNAGPAITVQPVGITVTAGATATFSVTATGNPAVTYQWNLGGVSLGAAARTASYTTAATTLGMNGNSYTVTVTNTLGSVTSSPAILTVDQAPVITTPPSGITVNAGATATFSVVATGNPAVAYQWNLNGVSLGATARASSYTTAATTLGMNGDSYTVTVSNTLNSVTSSAAILTVDQAPAITVQPSNDTVVNGSPATFSVTAIGNPLTYQWDVGGTAPAPGPVGTNSATYTIPATDLTMDGYTFTVTVTNTLGTVVSNTVTLNVTAAAIVSVSLSDASTEDWATIGVKVLRIALVPKDSGSPVPVYTAPVPVPVTNLVQLDNLSELLADASVPPGTYAGAVLTLAANPGDVALVTSADPSTGFKAPAATAIPPGQIRIQGATGTPGNLTVPVTVPLAADLVVAAGQRAALDLEFDLSHPAFILDHRAAGEPAPIWAVNFNGPVRHHPAAAARLVLRHLYGTVTAASADQAALKVTKVNPAWPGTSPETAQPTLQSLEIRADSANGTLFHDLDARTSSTILDFSSVSGALAGKYLRVAARRQADGTLVAARIWAGSSFGAVYSGPEGHVLHVDAGAGILTVAGPTGTAVPIQITPATRFFFRTAADAQADAKAIGTGPGFLGAHVVRGFKVHAAIDPAAPATAQTVDIEVARFGGQVTAASAGGFTCTRTFATAGDSYQADLGYRAGSGAGAGISAAGAVDFGGSVPPLRPWLVSFGAWGQLPAGPGWSAGKAFLEPTGLPLGQVASPWSGSAGCFGLALPGGANPVLVDLDLPGGSTQVFQVDRSDGGLAVTPLDLAGLADRLGNGATVRVFGIPRADGHLQASAVLIYTGTLPQ